MRAVIGLVLMLGAGPVGARAATTVLVMPLQPRAGVDQQLVDQVTEAVVAEAARLPGYRVVSMAEVQGTMTQEQIRQVVSCETESCAAEIAGALNTDEMVTGSLGRVGRSWLLVLTRISARSAFAATRVAESLDVPDASGIFERIPGIVHKLFGGIKPDARQVAPAPAPGRPRLILRAAGAGGLTATGLAAAAAVGLFVAVAVIGAVDFARGDWSTMTHGVHPLVGLGSNVMLGTAVASLIVAGLLGAASTALLLIPLVLP